MLFALLTSVMTAMTVIDGWSQHKMLQKPGNFEVSSIYGKHPSYGRYFEINLPVLAGALVWMGIGAFHYHFGWYWTGGAAFCAWHAYGTYLNAKNF